MEIQQLASKLSDAQFELKVAIAHGAKINQAKESLRNVLQNNIDEILKALDFAAKAEQQIKVLEVEIANADSELDEKDDEIANLKAEIEELKNTKSAPKKKGSAKGVE